MQHTAKAIDVEGSATTKATYSFNKNPKTGWCSRVVDELDMMINGSSAARVNFAGLIGGILQPCLALSASGAIAVPRVSMTYFITKASAAALTLVDPTLGTHDNVELSFISTTAAAHTLSNFGGSGFNGGGTGSDIGTFGGAIGDKLTIVAYQGKWYVKGNTNVTLA